MKLVNENPFNETVTYEIAPGRRVTLDVWHIREAGGVSALLSRLRIEHETPTHRLAVFQRGTQVGTLPADFDPYFVQSRSFLYDPRPGDFKVEGDHLVASDTLGQGDLEAIPGFLPPAEKERDDGA